MVMVDTTVWIDYLAARTNPETLWVKQQVSPQSVGLTDLILCEVLQGVRDDLRFNQIRLQLAAFPIISSGGVALAVAAAENCRSLRARGITVRKTIDCLIATFCIREGHELLHRDRDFDPFEQHLGLWVIHP